MKLKAAWRGLPRRSGIEWGARGFLAMALVILSYFAVCGTLAQVVRSSDPDRAHALAPGDARADAALALRTATNVNASASDRQHADRLAREALHGDPTAIAALSALGINAQSRGDIAAARRLFAYAQLLSRRDLVTQLWAIEDAVGRDDVAGAVRHYDIALRTSDRSAELLFPVLSDAITDPAIQEAVIRTLVTKPAWASSFINYVGTQGSNPQAAVDLYFKLHRFGVPVSGVAQGAVINALIQKGQVDAAWSYYALIRPGVDRSRSRDPQFAAEIEAPSPLDWGVVDVPGGSTSIQRGDNRSFFDFAVSPSVGGALLQQMQLLPPGDYRLAGHSMNLDQPSGSLPYWTLVCRDGREVGRVDMPPSAQANGVFVGRFRVPEGCPVQVLTLFARPSDSISGVSGQVDQVRLDPLR